MKEIKEILKEVSYVIPQEEEQDFLTVVDLSDAIMITKDLYGREQVEESIDSLINKYNARVVDDKIALCYGAFVYELLKLKEKLSAPSPLGEKS